MVPGAWGRLLEQEHYLWRERAAMDIVKSAAIVVPVVLVTAATVIGVGVLIGISAWGPR
jgi:predicted anti-sigma-YlaC factor YlaD